MIANTTLGELVTFNQSFAPKHGLTVPQLAAMVGDANSELHSTGKQLYGLFYHNGFFEPRQSRGLQSLLSEVMDQPLEPAFIVMPNNQYLQYNPYAVHAYVAHGRISAGELMQLCGCTWQEGGVQ